MNETFITTIYLHTIEFWYKDWPEFDGELPESEEEHIKEMIAQGCWQGELCYVSYDPDTNTEEEHHGWWRIKGDG